MDSSFWILGAKLVAQFGKVIEPLKCWPLREHVFQLGKAFRFCNPNAFQVLFLCFLRVDEICSFCFFIPSWSHSAALMSSFMLNCIPCNYKLKEALFSSKLLLVIVYYYSNIKITNILDSLKQWDVLLTEWKWAITYFEIKHVSKIVMTPTMVSLS